MKAEEVRVPQPRTVRVISLGLVSGLAQFVEDIFCHVVSVCSLNNNRYSKKTPFIH